MSEQKKPQAGEWWFATSNPGDRLYIVGQCDAGRTVFQYSKGCQLMIDRDGNWSGWHHEPRCTGWEWQPEPEPEWFDLTAMDGHVLRTGIDHVQHRSGGWASVSGMTGCNIGDAKRYGWVQFRCLIKDAPKPAKDPDEWVTQDRVPVRSGIDEFCYGHDKWSLATDADNFTSRAVHGWGSLQVRCRRRDLPPKPEPKPATQTIAFHECIVTQGCPPDYYTLEWVSDVPKHSNWIPTGRTETREVVR